MSVSARANGVLTASAARTAIPIIPHISVLTIIKIYLFGVCCAVLDLPQGMATQARIAFLCGASPCDGAQ